MGTKASTRIGLILTLATTPAGAQECAEFNTWEFFQTASTEQIRDCISAGADINARTESGLTPFDLAKEFNAEALENTQEWWELFQGQFE